MLASQGISALMCCRRLQSGTRTTPSAGYSYQLRIFAVSGQCPMATHFGVWEQDDIRGSDQRLDLPK